jgi:hypothetical protein
MRKILIVLFLIVSNILAAQKFNTDSVFFQGTGLKTDRTFVLSENTLMQEFAGHLTLYKRASKVKKVKIGKYRFDRWDAIDVSDDSEVRIFYKERHSIAIEFRKGVIAEYLIEKE